MTETPTTAHRWRSITRAQTKRSDEDAFLVSSLVKCVSNVMLAAGWKAKDSTSNRRDFIREKYSGQIGAIVRYVLQLRKAIGEDIVSEDIEVAFVEPNNIFEGQTMEDAYAVGSRREDRSRQTAFDIQVVACTSDIGLRRAKSGRDVTGSDVLLRPKVVLQSAFNEIL